VKQKIDECTRKEQVVQEEAQKVRRGACNRVARPGKRPGRD